MADREQPYDPYIPSGGNQPRDNGNQRTAALQAVGLPSSPGRQHASQQQHRLSDQRGSGQRGTGSSRGGFLARHRSQHLRYGTKASLRLGF